MDREDVRERTVMVKVEAESRAWRMEGPSLPLAPTRVILVSAITREFLCVVYVSVTPL